MYLKVVKLVNFKLCIFYHNKKRNEVKKKWNEVLIQSTAKKNLESIIKVKARHKSYVSYHPMYIISSQDRYIFSDSVSRISTLLNWS